MVLLIVGREKDAEHPTLASPENGRGVCDGRLGSLLVTSQRAPTFSVMSIRPSGRKAIFQGRFRVVTFAMWKGRPGSGFCSPALICADARAHSHGQEKSCDCQTLHLVLPYRNRLIGRTKSLIDAIFVAARFDR